MQYRVRNGLDRALTCLGVNISWDAASVVYYLDATVGEHLNHGTEVVAKPAGASIDTIVDNFPYSG